MRRPATATSSPPRKAPTAYDGHLADRRDPRAAPSASRSVPAARQDSDDERLEAALRQGGVGVESGPSVNAILAICQSLSSRSSNPYTAGALSLLARAAMSLRQLGVLGDATNLGPLGQLAESGTLRAVACALLALRDVVDTSKETVTFGPTARQAAVVSDLRDAVQFAESTVGRSFDSLSSEQKTALANHVASIIATYLGRRPVPVDLLPAMDVVTDEWEWQLERENRTVSRAPDPRRKARIFVDMLAKIGLEPHGVGALYQCVEIHVPRLLSPSR